MLLLIALTACAPEQIANNPEPPPLEEPVQPIPVGADEPAMAAPPAEAAAAARVLEPLAPEDVRAVVVELGCSFVAEGTTVPLLVASSSVGGGATRAAVRRDGSPVTLDSELDGFAALELGGTFGTEDLEVTVTTRPLDEDGGEGTSREALLEVTADGMDAPDLEGTWMCGP